MKYIMKHGGKGMRPYTLETGLGRVSILEPSSQATQQEVTMYKITLHELIAKLLLEECNETQEESAS